MTLPDSIKSLAPWALAGALFALVVAALDPVRPFDPWGYLALLVPGAVAVWASWRWITANDGPSWLPYAVGAAVVLRIGVGLLLTRGLPIYGYPDSEPHQAGYYYQDAMFRDRAAWDLAGSGAPLVSAFTDPSRSDQYGGLLYFDSWLYRTLSPQAHRPLLPIAASSVAAGLGVLLAWGFVERRFGRTPASVTAWGMALYPESVLLGASQMREPYLIAAFAGALFGYQLVRHDQLRAATVTLAVSLLLGAAISPPYALIFAVVLLTAWLWEGRGRGTRTAILVVAIALLGLGLTAGAWQRLESAPQDGLPGLLNWWVVSGAQFELYQLERGSGFVQKLFDLAPEWAHLPMATGNGLVQPFLPATLLDSTSLPLPRLLGILRGLGWFVLLPFLLYAPLAAVRSAGWRSLQSYLSVLIWVTAIGASYRLAGDQWDNPRARAVFLAAQLALAGWALVHARSRKSAWLIRSGVVVAGSTLIFLQWYAGRYYHTPRLNLNQTTALVGAFIVAVLAAGLVLDNIRRPSRTQLTTQPPEV